MHITDIGNIDRNWSARCKNQGYQLVTGESNKKDNVIIENGIVNHRQEREENDQNTIQN